MAHGRRSFAKKIQSVHWTGGAWQFIGQAAGVAAGTFGSAQHLPETLMRFRGAWSACLGTAVSATSGALVTCGLIQVPEGTGTTVLWSPFTDADAPWIWWDTFNLLYQEMVTDVIATQNTMSGARVIDSKAMRKLRNTELQIVLENTAIPGYTTRTIDVAGSARALSGS